MVHRTNAALIQADREKALLDLTGRCDIVADYLSDATRVTEGIHGQVRVRKDYSYATGSFARDGMLLVGDAACFITPSSPPACIWPPTAGCSPRARSTACWPASWTRPPR